MANKSIRDLRRKKLREKKIKRRKNLITGALNIDFKRKTDDFQIRKPVENRYAQANKKAEAKEENKEIKAIKTQVATPIGFESVVITDGEKIDNDGYSDTMKSYVKSLKSQYCYQEPSDFTKTDVSINKNQYVEYYGTENSFSKIKINDDFYYVNKYGLGKLKDEENTSEHQTGTCFDFYTDSTKYSNKFKETDEYKWLKENAYKYGFIQRYTKDKEKITGKKERCWHFRYVGVENAKSMFENNLSLEEYLKIK